jgi:hypothetical protein
MSPCYFTFTAKSCIKLYIFIKYWLLFVRYFTKTGLNTIMTIFCHFHIVPAEVTVEPTNLRSLVAHSTKCAPAGSHATLFSLPKVALNFIFLWKNRPLFVTAKMIYGPPSALLLLTIRPQGWYSQNYLQTLDSGSSTVAEHSTLNPKVKGSLTDTNPSTGRKKMTQVSFMRVI